MSEELVMQVQPSLRRRSFRAAMWAGGSHVISQVVRLAGNLVLTRLLLPEAFGLMAVISTVIMALNLLSDIGSGTVIVQSERGTDETFLSTAWTLQILRGFGLWICALLFVAGVDYAQNNDWFRVGTVYDDERLPLLLAVATAVLVIQGFTSFNAKLGERKLELRRIAAIDLATQVIGIVVMVAGAMVTQSIWALVGGSLVTAALKCAASHWMLSGPPLRLRLEREALQELVGKGKWVLISSLLGFLAMNGDRVLLGGLIDSYTLGLYSIAFGLSSIATSAISTILGRVVFPAFSEVVRERPDQLESTYRKFQRAADALIGLLAGFMFVGAQLVIDVLYDPRYRDAAHMFRMLAIGSIGVRYLVTEQIYVAMGRTGLLAAAILPRVVILLVGLPIGHALAGLDGALLAIVLSWFGHWPQALWFRSQHGLNRLSNDIVLLPAIVIGALVAWAAVALAAALHLQF
jgi:O-antigen/teichoic acid export membrane protein